MAKGVLLSFEFKNTGRLNGKSKVLHFSFRPKRIIILIADKLVILDSMLFVCLNNMY